MHTAEGHLSLNFAPGNLWVAASAAIRKMRGVELESWAFHEEQCNRIEVRGQWNLIDIKSVFWPLPCQISTKRY